MYMLTSDGKPVTPSPQLLTGCNDAPSAEGAANASIVASEAPSASRLRVMAGLPPAAAWPCASLPSQKVPGASDDHAAIRWQRPVWWSLWRLRRPHHLQ